MVDFEENKRLVQDRLAAEVAKKIRTLPSWMVEHAKQKAAKEVVEAAVCQGVGLLLPTIPLDEVLMEDTCAVCYSPGAFIPHIVWPERRLYTEGASYRVSGKARALIEEDALHCDVVNVQLDTGERVVVTTDEAFALGLREVEFECNPPR